MRGSVEKSMAGLYTPVQPVFKSIIAISATANVKRGIRRAFNVIRGILMQVMGRNEEETSFYPSALTKQRANALQTTVWFCSSFSDSSIQLTLNQLGCCRTFPLCFQRLGERLNC